jgi:hypothetical protein
MLPAHVDLREGVLIADRLGSGVDVRHDPIHLKIRDHLLDAVGDGKRAGSAQGLEDVRPLFSDPLMFEVAPTSLENEAMDGVLDAGGARARLRGAPAIGSSSSQSIG